MTNQDGNFQVSISNNQPQDPLLDVWNLNGYLFDAWLTLSHDDSITTTQHPVQSGAAITDHAYVNPKRFTFQIGMTDVTHPLNYPGATPMGVTPSKSIGAYDAIVELQRSREPLYLVSKYGYFENILIENINTPDDFRTRHSLKATISLVQIIMVDAQSTRLSGIPHNTDQTNRGPVSGRPIPGSFEYAWQKTLEFGGLAP